jgi:hypothetical protein
MAIRDEGIYEFNYVNLVDDKCLWASQRVDDYGIYGFPTTYWDGGFRVDLGAGSIPTAKAAYENSIIVCGGQAVADIDIDLSVLWLGGNTMEISVSVVNNEATQYDGYIRVFVTEISSSLGWNDSYGIPYSNAFLDYAFNEDCTIPAGGSWDNSVTWVGADHNNGYSTNYSTITQDNINVIAAVYNDEWHQGYSYPPYSYPFDAYWVDESQNAFPLAMFYSVDDDDDDFYEVEGSWAPFQFGQAQNGTLHFSAAGSGENIAGWRVDTVIDPDTYDVYVWKFDHPLSHLMADNVPYKVKHAGGLTDPIHVDQSSPGDEWVHRGQFDCDNNTIQGVVLSNDANGVVIADAVRLDRVME